MKRYKIEIAKLSNNSIVVTTSEFDTKSEVVNYLDEVIGDDIITLIITNQEMGKSTFRQFIQDKQPISRVEGLNLTTLFNF